MRLIRGIIDSVVEGAIKRISSRGIAGESFSNREYFQHYGFTSMPFPGAEKVAIKDGNVVITIASDDRRYRIAIEEGEVALYDSQGQKVHLKKDNAMELVCTGILTMKAATKIRMETPKVEVSGALVSETSVADPKGTMQEVRDTFNPHKHGTGPTPDRTME